MNSSKLQAATKSQSEMRDVATRICREYLSGAWKTISSDEIQVKRISGGLSNFLYYVSLPTAKKEVVAGSISTKRTRKESYHNQLLEPTPCSVLLRIYGQTHGEHALETMLTESVVFTLLSERQLGPKLHGIFPGGRIEQYIPARSLTTAELASHQISLRIAEKMSEIHSLDIPVSKEPDWLFLTLNRWLNNVETIMTDVKNNNNNEDGNDQDLPKRLSKIDFRKESQWLRKVIEVEDFPVTFCHNDLQEGNILFRQSNFTPSYDDEQCDGELGDLSPLLISTPTPASAQEPATATLNGNSRKRSLPDNSLDSDVIDSNTSQDDGFSDVNDVKPELMIIDFEYCAYNYRAFDIANHFLEWTYDYTNDKFPYFYNKKECYPTAQQIDDFITVYLSRTNDEVPTLQEKQQLLNEIALFSLASHLFWAIWGIVNINQDIEFGYWDYANLRTNEYFAAKEKYFELNPRARDICDLETRRK